jgi:phosphate transport system protein
MVKFIEEELMTIRKEILDMWALVYDQIKTVCEAIPTADKKKAWKVLIREKRVNASELKIDCDVEDFLVLYNPVAIDLRFALGYAEDECRSGTHR